MDGCRFVNHNIDTQLQRKPDRRPVQSIWQANENAVNPVFGKSNLPSIFRDATPTLFGIGSGKLFVFDAVPADPGDLDMQVLLLTQYLQMRQIVIPHLAAQTDDTQTNRRLHN